MGKKRVSASYLTALIECSIIFGSPLRTQRSAKVATEVQLFREVLAANAKSKKQAA